MWTERSEVAFHYCYHLFLFVLAIVSVFINIVGILFSTEVFIAVTFSFWFICFDTVKYLYYCFLAWFLPSLIFYYTSHFLFVLLFLVFFVLLSQQRFWSVSGTKLIKFQWVPYTPEGVCVGKAWCSAWPHSRFQSQTCPESAGRQAFWWGLEVKVNMLFFSEWSHSPQKQLRCLLLQEALMSFTPVWITYVAATSTPSPKQFFLLL